MDVQVVREPQTPKPEYALPVAVLSSNLVILARQFYPKFEQLQEHVRLKPENADYELTLSKCKS